MTIAIRSFAKINLGLKIGPARPDGFHELRTIYQTLALHDLVRVEAQPGSGIEIRCNDSRVPLDATNTCYKMAERVLAEMATGGRTRPMAGEPQIPRLRLRSLGMTKIMTGLPYTAQPKLHPFKIGLKPCPFKAEPWGSLSSQGSHRHRQAPAGAGGLKRSFVHSGRNDVGDGASALGVSLSTADKLRLAAEVGSDVPLVP